MDILVNTYCTAIYNDFALLTSYGYLSTIEYMKYDRSIKNKARQLRLLGYSLREISDKTNVPITTIRTWILDIRLSEKQLNILKERSQKALQNGRARTQAFNKEQRIKKEKELTNNGKEEIGELSSRDLFIAGIALYWAEGFRNKHEHRLGFCNSDPNMVKFYIYWLEKCIGIRKDAIIARLTLNYSYKDKVDEMTTFWSRIIGIHLTQFTKPFYQTSKWKKQYNTKNYHGVLRIHVKDSLNYLLKMKGWIEGLKMIK